MLNFPQKLDAVQNRAIQSCPGGTAEVDGDLEDNAGGRGGGRFLEGRIEIASFELRDSELKGFNRLILIIL